VPESETRYRAMRGSTDVHFLITYIVAKDVNKRTDEAAPRCAVALGLM
jgi:hypothetical protein